MTPDNVSESLASYVKSIVWLLVAGRFEEVAKVTNNIRMDADDVERAVGGYGKTLVMPPDESFENLDIVQVRRSTPPCWSVRFDMWTVEEGRSDLTLELSITLDGGRWCVGLDDIHVL